MVTLEAAELRHILDMLLQVYGRGHLVPAHILESVGLDAEAEKQLTSWAAENYAIAPIEPNEEMIDAGLQATAARLDIKGSAITVNREKMRLRYKAMIAAIRPDCYT